MISFMLSFILSITMVLLYKLGDMGETTFFITTLTFSTYMAIYAFYGLSGQKKSHHTNCQRDGD